MQGSHVAATSAGMMEDTIEDMHHRGPVQSADVHPSLF